MDHTENHRADQNQHTVGHGVKEARQHAPAFRLPEDLSDLLGGVAEEAARQRAHDEGRDAAVEQQPAEGQRPFSGLDLRHGHQGRDHHDQAVAHIRHHQAVEQDEEGRHQRVRIHAVIGRERIHVRDHVQRVGDPVVLQLNRDVGILRRVRFFGLPGTAVAFQD